jgi:hypothetical protein
MERHVDACGTMVERGCMECSLAPARSGLHRGFQDLPQEFLGETGKRLERLVPILDLENRLYRFKLSQHSKLWRKFV